ncbi:MAG: 3-amino-5-hydroxybenzoate synthase [Chloroflexota bacterium]|jgi:dTDP-4-amino-4,6-dideoxygalactose transaminase
MSERLAIAGGSPTRSTEYPTWPVIDADDEAIVLEALRSGRWGGYPEPGPYNARFCADFAKFQGSTHGILMVNGTVTMEVALTDVCGYRLRTHGSWGITRGGRR